MANATHLGSLVVAVGLALAASAGPVGAQDDGHANANFTFALTGAPAAQLAVRSGHGAGAATGITDADGRLDFALQPGRLHVVDTLTGTVLADRYVSDPPTQVSVPVPLRLHGLLLGFGNDPTKTEVHFGYDDARPVADYQRLVHDLRLSPRPQENRVHGLELPDIPATWRQVRPDSDSDFDSGWLPVSGPVDIIARHRDGRTAITRYRPSADVAPRDAVRLEPLHVQFGASLDVEIEAPDSDLPLALMLGISQIAPGNEARRETARRLALLNRVDRDLGQLLTTRLEHPLQLDGTTRLVGLPPLERLNLYLAGPAPGITAKRQIEVPRDGTVRIRFSQEDLLGDTKTRTRFEGVARFPDGSPAANATVVYSSYPHRLETQADEQGRFAFDQVPRERPGIVLIDTHNPTGKPPFDRLTVTFPIDAPEGAATHSRSFTVPRPSGEADLMQPQSFGQPRSDGQQLHPPIGERYTFCDGNYTQSGSYLEGPVLSAFERISKNAYSDEVDIIVSQSGVTKDGLGWAQVTFPKQGTYRVVAEYTPFIVSFDETFVPAEHLTQNLSYQPFLQSLEPTATFMVFRPGGGSSPVGADLQVSYPSVSDATGPYDDITDGNGQIQISCINIHNVYNNQLPIFVRDDDVGYFDGFLNLAERGPNIQLQPVPTQ